MDEENSLARLPEAYAAALRLRRGGVDDGAIAEQLGLEPQAIGPLLRLAEAKLAALGEPPDEPVSTSRRPASKEGGERRE